ncbi:unnamed protein product [Polarella glacialis]|uniref:Uncharacterized protein n=1 Tax=Polarella glacialis TaxID=89957 RepID=A0A813JRJ8_POLGL|nr:unnamed protein product [Polarella glacialis]
MKCVRVTTFMEFDVMPSYGELLAKDLLVEPSDNAAVHLISHEWLSRRHPDPDSNQLRQMQGVFLEILAGRIENLFSKDDWMTFSKGASIGSQRSQLAAAESAQRCSDTITEDTFKQDFEEGLIWLDWSSIPQVLEALHKDQKTLRDFNTYRTRAWCRLEEWANLLSLSSKMPLVVTEAPSIATYSSLTFVLDNAGRPERGPCSGQLSCCSAGHSISIAGERKSIPCDMISMQSVLEKLYAAKMDSLANSLLVYSYTLLETTIAVEREKPTLEEFAQKWRISGHEGRNEHDFAILYIAALTGNDPIVRELLGGRRKGEPWLVDKTGLTAFHSVMGYEATTKLFLETGDIGKEQIDGYNTWGAANIHMSSEYGSTEMLRLLLANDAEVDLPKRPCSAYAGRTALHCAALRSQFECCEILIRHGASVHARDARGATVLHMAALEPLCLVGDQDPNTKMTTLRLLLEAKADPSVRNDGGHTAAELLALASGHSAGEIWLALCTHDPLMHIN